MSALDSPPLGLDPREAATPARVPALASGAWQALPLAACALVFAVLLLKILAITGGASLYSLDDAYIHLAVSEEIARGHYGVNPQEPAAAASSIVYPFLLAPFAATPFHAAMPLVWNALFTLLSLLTGWRILSRLPLPAGTTSDAFRAALLTALALLFNWVGLAFTGLDHSLQLWVSLLVLDGALGFLRDGRAHHGWLAAIALAPLVRYENLTVSGSALLLLALAGRWRALGAAALPMLGLLAGFSAFLLSQGLGPLPSSVLVKADVLPGGDAGPFGFAAGALRHAGESLSHTSAIFSLLLLSATLAGVCIWRSRERALLALFAAGPVLGHLCGGRYGSFQRYEIYVLSLAGCAALLAWGPGLARLLALPALRPVLVAGPLLAALAPALPSGFYSATRLTPEAARDIYEQHHQMHRFAAELHAAPVGVKDLGWVAYRNDHFVLDLTGLGHEGIRRAKAEGRWHGLASLEPWLDRHDVALLMLYDRGHELPTGWRRLARLHLSRPPVSASGSAVTFVSTRSGAHAALSERLSAFAPTLPDGVRLELLPTP